MWSSLSRGPTGSSFFKSCCQPWNIFLKVSVHFSQELETSCKHHQLHHFGLHGGNHPQHPPMLAKGSLINRHAAVTPPVRDQLELTSRWAQSWSKQLLAFIQHTFVVVPFFFSPCQVHLLTAQNEQTCRLRRSQLRDRS